MISIPWQRGGRPPAIHLPPSRTDEIRISHLRPALDAVAAPLVVVNPSGEIALVNPAAASLFLYEANQLEGRSIRVLLPPTYGSEHAVAVAAFLAAPACRAAHPGIRLIVLRKDGTEFLVEIGLSPFPTSEGICVVASIVDLTEWTAVTAARDQAELFQAYCEAASEGMIAVDASGTIEMVNQASERIFGYDRSELLGKPLAILIPGGFQHAHVGNIAGYFADPKLRPMKTVPGLVGERKDGTQFPLEVGLNVAHIGGRAVAIGVITDASEKRRLEEESTVLAGLLDLQQRVAISKRQVISSDRDALTGLPTRTMFERVIKKSNPDLLEFYIIFYFVHRMQQMSERYGPKIADQIVVFASQYIGSKLDRNVDQLFRWEDGFLVLVRRNSNSMTVRREAERICYPKLECRMNQTGLESLFVVELTAKVLPLAHVPLVDVVATIDRFVRSPAS